MVARRRSARHQRQWVRHTAAYNVATNASMKGPQTTVNVDRSRETARTHPYRPLDRETVRARLRVACLGAPSEGPDAPPGGPDAVSEEWAGSSEGVPAAVLIGLLDYAEGPRIILTERTAHLRNHAGQISLPGGRVEEGDDGPAAAALREAFEEIGLAPGRVELLGCLPTHRTVSDFLVHPFVGWVKPPVDYVPDPCEVAEVFEVPLGFVLDPANHIRESLEWQGALRSYYVLPYPGHRIWGATAGILVSLARALTP